MPEATSWRPETALAEGFARHVRRWARNAGATPQAEAVAAQAARRLSLACASGDVCLPLADIPGQSGWPAGRDEARRLLRSSGVVGSVSAPGSLPMILDADDRLYLHRYFDYERRLARRIAMMRSAPPDLGDAVSLVRAGLDRLFAADAGGAGDSPDWQRVAVAMAMANRFTVVSGGPGTGKTTMVVNLLACLLSLDPGIRIALAAPTGKAAGRMTEAIRRGAVALPESIRAGLPNEAFTVHRLIGMRGADDGPARRADNPLPVDLLVVDEASMLDLALATLLLEAVPETARVVLLGDKDQLSSVESGAVFSDLSSSPALTATFRERLATICGVPARLLEPPRGTAGAPLVDAAVWFTRNFRFARDSGIGRLAAAINAGDDQGLVDRLRAAGDPATRWMPTEGPPGDEALLREAVAGYAPFVDAVRAAPDDPEAITAAFGRFRVLCALREGWRGAASLNDALTRWLRPRLPRDVAGDASQWYPGRPVMVLHNDYVLKLFNGDVGIALQDPVSGDLTVRFPLPGGGFRSIPTPRMPEHETAFAMTVHKSQGSEFDEVLLALPARENRVLTRELIYTAVTRARTRVTLAGGENVLRSAVRAATVRRSGLAARLAEAV